MDISDRMIDIEALWDYDDPAASEERFRAALNAAQNDERLELLTQVARTYSLRRRFEEAHQVLDDVEQQLGNAGERPAIRYLLERGRTFRSAGETERSRPLFIKAWERAQSSRQEGLAADAAHMVAITYSGTPEALVWNERGLAIAKASQDSKARSLVKAFLNNSAWDLFEMKRLDEALLLFEEALAEYTSQGNPTRIREAKWAVARCLRELRRYDQALTIQRGLEAELDAAGAVDGNVYEEIAENLALLGRQEDARHYHQKAIDALSQDTR